MIAPAQSLRLIHTEKRKTVYILCSVPLDIPIDELVTWKEPTGDRRLSDALAECDERGWDALPLAPKELARLLRDLWPTKKSAERWVAKNPPEAYRDIIRAKVLGVTAEDIRVKERETAFCDKDRACGQPGGINHK